MKIFIDYSWWSIDPSRQPEQEMHSGNCKPEELIKTLATADGLDKLVISLFSLCDEKNEGEVDEYLEDNNITEPAIIIYCSESDKYGYSKLDAQHLNLSPEELPAWEEHFNKLISKELVSEFIEWESQSL